MADTLTPLQRSAQMSRIRGSDTALELVVRKALHAYGLRYRLGGAGLPGRPDVVFPKHRVALFVHGCFWHGHTCNLFRLPKTRTDFWAAKIKSNRARDTRVAAELKALNWRVLELWECELRAKPPAEKMLRLELLATEISGREITLPADLHSGNFRTAS